MKIFKVILLVLVVWGAQANAQNLSNLNANDEGTRTTLTADEVASVKTWVLSLKQNLQTTLGKLNSVSLSDSKTILLEGIRSAVRSSSGKTAETLSRYTLNRALKIAEIMEQTPSQSLDQEVALLVRAAKLAGKYAESDIAFLANPNAINEIPFAQFGVECAELLMSINESTINAQTQFKIGVYALGLFRKDLSEDSNHAQYLPAMAALSVLLDHEPKPDSDEEAVELYRNVRKSYHDGVEGLKGTSLKASHLSGMSAIAIGPGHACAVIQSAVFCWGANRWGQLGDGTQTDSQTPVQVKGISGASGVAVGDEHSCAIAKGLLYCWGYHSVITSVTTTHMESALHPYLIEDLHNVTEVSAIGRHTCAVADKLAYCWGENFDNVFPNPKHHYDMIKDSSTPIQFPNAKNVTSLAVGTDHTCVLAGNKVVCAGNGLYGGMGNGGRGDQWQDKGVHAKIGESEMIVEFGAQTCAVSQGSVYCWGAGIYTPVRIGSSEEEVQSSLAMNYHCTNLNGLSLCWDENKIRETADNTAWKINEDTTQAIDAIQALDLGIGVVSSVSATPFGTCVIVSLASGNQEFYCAGDRGMRRMTMFDNLTIAAYQNPGPYVDPQRDLFGGDLELLADYRFFCKYVHKNYNENFTPEEFLSQSPEYLKQNHKDRVREDKILKRMGSDPRNDSYQHPVGCAAKRVAKGLLLGPFAGRNDGC